MNKLKDTQCDFISIDVHSNVRRFIMAGEKLLKKYGACMVERRLCFKILSDEELFLTINHSWEKVLRGQKATNKQKQRHSDNDDERGL